LSRKDDICDSICLLSEVNLGIDLNSAQLLIEAHKSGVSFERVATLGRQRLIGDREKLVSVLKKAGYAMSKACVARLLATSTEYSEEFFALLGAKEIFSIDVSDFEGANILHDMNQPLPHSLISSFDVVLDGGTLEHIFDLPTALRNATKMVRPNGRFISLTQANNFCGHGFYQFSPELFYRFLCSKNGFTTEYCILWEDIPGSPFYRIPDPDVARTRINLTSEFGLNMTVQAKRTGEMSETFVPQQSDYVRMWEAQPAEDDRLNPAIEGPPIWTNFRSFLKGIPGVRPAVRFARKLLRIPQRQAIGEYRRLGIRKNTLGLLSPLRNLRVIR
jgi:SAM-dependent methyltransferase